VDGIPTDGTAVDDDVTSRFAYDQLGELLAYCPARAVAGTDACDPGWTDTASSKYTSAWHYTYDAMGRQTTTIPPVNVAAAAQNTSATVYEPGGRVAMTCTLRGALNAGGGVGGEAVGILLLGGANSEVPPFSNAAGMMVGAAIGGYLGQGTATVGPTRY
jgi:hypothetical protein